MRCRSGDGSQVVDDRVDDRVGERSNSAVFIGRGSTVAANAPEHR